MSTEHSTFNIQHSTPNGGGPPPASFEPSNSGEQRIESYGSRPLRNAEAKPIALKLMRELAAEFDEDGVWKIIRNLDQFHEKTTHRLYRERKAAAAQLMGEH